MRTMAVTPIRAAILIAAMLAGGSGVALAKDATSSSPKEKASTPDFEWREPLAAGKTLAIKGVSGSITASLASGTETQVTARKRARHGDPDGVRIEVARSDDGITICAVYPSPKGENSCESGDGWHSDTDQLDVDVDFVVTVPAGVKFTALNVNGDVEARGLKSPVELRTVNGSATLETNGYGEASTVNGGIRAVLGSDRWPGTLEFKTVNGSIDLTLPKTVSARVNGSTMVGPIESDFPVTVQGEFGPRTLRGTIGSGASRLTCENINGSIRLRAK